MADSTTVQVETTTGSKTSRTRYTYGAHGNLERENHDGDTSTTSDDWTLFRDFNVNASKNILSTVASISVFEGDKTVDTGSGKMAETFFFYDGNNLDGDHQDDPTIGDVTRVRTMIDGSNYANTFATYDTYGNRLTATDANNATTSWVYDSNFRSLPTKETYPAVGTSPAMEEEATWDFGTGNMASWTDVNGETTTYEYDTFGRITKVVRPGDTSASATVVYNYNSFGTIEQQNLETVARIDDASTTWSKAYFDGLGRTVQVHSEGDTEGTTTYVMVSGTTDFNDRGLVDKGYLPQRLGSTTLNGFEAPGAGWEATTYAYDGLARVSSTAAPDGTVVTHDYSTAWRDTVTDPAGYKTRYINDAFGRLVQVDDYDASGTTVYASTTYVYDVLGNLTKVTDSAANDTTMTYGMLSRKVVMGDPDMGVWRYTYDDNGNLTAQNDAKDATVTLTYDGLNRLTAKTYPAGSNTTNVTFSYDATTAGNKGLGRRTGTVGDATATWVYDSRGRVASETITINGDAQTFAYTYDKADRLTVVTYPDGETATQTYDDHGLPLTLSGSVSGDLVTNADSNRLGLPTSLSFNNGVSTTYEYFGIEHNSGSDADFGRLFEVLTKKSSTELQHLEHAWDDNGNLTQRVNRVGTTETEDFTYDVLDRLTDGDSYREAGLVGLWRFNDGTGTAAEDTTSNNNDGTLINGPTWTTGKDGDALHGRLRRHGGIYPDQQQGQDHSPRVGEPRNHSGRRRRCGQVGQ